MSSLDSRIESLTQGESWRKFGKFATSMDFRSILNPSIRFKSLSFLELEIWKMFEGLPHITMEIRTWKKLIAEQTNPQRIWLRCLLGIAALRSRTGVSCVCCNINELRPHSGFRRKIRDIKILWVRHPQQVSTWHQNPAWQKIDKICTFLYHLNSASCPHCKTVPSGIGNHGPTKALKHLENFLKNKISNAAMVW